MERRSDIAISAIRCSSRLTARGMESHCDIARGWKMKLISSLLIALSASTLNGCLYGQCMNGPCALEHSRIVKSVKPYGVHWVKEGMTTESRRDDSWACGAARTEPAANGPIFSNDDIALEKSVIDENDYEPRGRLFDKWGKCMQSKGYAYLEECDARCLHP